MTIKPEPHELRNLNSLIGKTVRWTLSDGSGNKSTYLHHFDHDGSIVFWGGDGKGRGTRIRASRAFVKFSDGIFVISYLNRPYTLSVILNAKNGKAVGFASSEKFWMRFTGKWELVRLEGEHRAVGSPAR